MGFATGFVPPGGATTFFLKWEDIPQYTNATRPAASSVEPGVPIYNLDSEVYNVSDGTKWRNPAGYYVGQ